MSRVKKIAVFASGRGSNLVAQHEAITKGQLHADIALVVSDQPHCLALKKAQQLGLDTFSFSSFYFTTKKAYESEVLARLKEKNVDWIVLAGYMRRIGTTLLAPYTQRIVNIHPSLLPSFKGLNAIEAAFKFGVKVTGVTIHDVNEEIDGGNIIAQMPVLIDKGMTLEELEERVHNLEHRMYPEVLNLLLNK